MALKITKVEIETVQSMFEWTFVRIYSGELYGTGEANPAPGLKDAATSLRKLLLGEDAFKITRIEEKLKHASLYAGTSFYNIISAVDMALYDLIGRHANLPVWRLLGGDREEVRVYVDAHAGGTFEIINSLLIPFKHAGRVWKPGAKMGLEDNPIMGRLAQEKWQRAYTPDAYAKRAKEMMKAGYTAIKFDLDIPTPYTKRYSSRSGGVSLMEADYMGEVVKAVRAAVGGDYELMIDLHWRYNVNSALRICRALEPYRLRWIEDLTPATRSVGNLAELRLLTSRSSIPVATGENMHSVYQFKDLLDTGVLVWTPDLAKAGGVSEGRRIAELAAMYDIEYSPHNISSPIGTMATAHAASMANTFGVLEFHCHDFPVWNEMVKPKKEIIDKGFIHLSDEPGLGVQLDDKYMSKNWEGFKL